MKRNGFFSLICIAVLLQASYGWSGETQDDVLLGNELNGEVSNNTEFPVKVCVGALGYSGNARKTDELYCREGNGAARDECMKKRAGRANFKLLVINKKIEIQPHQTIYLKKKKYSLLLGDSGIQKDFSKDSNLVWRLDAANYGGLALDPVNRCKTNK